MLILPCLARWNLRHDFNSNSCCGIYLDKDTAARCSYLLAARLLNCRGRVCFPCHRSHLPLYDMDQLVKLLVALSSIKVAVLDSCTCSPASLSSSVSSASIFLRLFFALARPLPRPAKTFLIKHRQIVRLLHCHCKISIHTY